jgi:hypothetical protein
LYEFQNTISQLANEKIRDSNDAVLANHRKHVWIAVWVVVGIVFLAWVGATVDQRRRKEIVI